MSLHNYWYLICLEEELQKKNPLSRRINGQDYVVFRTADGKVSVLEDRCCHRHVALSLGAVCGDRIRCAYHGWEFSGEGRCVAIPSLTDDTQIPATARVKSFPVQVVHRMVWFFPGAVELAGQTPLPPIPEAAHLPRTFNYHEVKADLKLVAESLIDPYHIDYVHKDSIKTFMGNINRESVTFAIHQNPVSMTGSYYRKNRATFFERFYFGSEKEIKTEFGFWFPHTSKLKIFFPQKQRTLIIYEHFYPIDDNRICMLQVTLWENIFSGMDTFARFFMDKISNRIVEEDIAFLESNLNIQQRNARPDLILRNDAVSIAFAKLWREQTT